MVLISIIHTSYRLTYTTALAHVHSACILSESSLPTSDDGSNVWPLLYGKAPTAGVSLRPVCQGWGESSYHLGHGEKLSELLSVTLHMFSLA